MKLSTREKRLLYVLVFVVILAAFVLVDKQISTAESEAQNELTSLEMQVTEKRAAIGTLEDVQRQITELDNSTAQTKSKLYEYLYNREIDNIITNIATNNELTHVALSMGESQNMGIPSYYSLISDAESSEQTADEQANESSDIWISDVDFTARGTEEQILGFIDEISSHSAMHVKALSYSPNGTSKTDVRCTIQVYMYYAAEDAYAQTSSAAE